MVEHSSIAGKLYMPAVGAKRQDGSAFTTAAAHQSHAAPRCPQPRHLRSRDNLAAGCRSKCTSSCDNPTSCGGMQVAATAVCGEPIHVAQHHHLDSDLPSRWACSAERQRSQKDSQA